MRVIIKGKYFPTGFEDDGVEVEIEFGMEERDLPAPRVSIQFPGMAGVVLVDTGELRNVLMSL